MSLDKIEARDAAASNNPQGSLAAVLSEKLERRTLQLERLQHSLALALEALDESYVTMAAAFERIHQLPRSADGGLARRLGEARGKIEQFRRTQATQP